MIGLLRFLIFTSRSSSERDWSNLIVSPRIRVCCVRDILDFELVFGAVHIAKEIRLTSILSVLELLQFDLVRDIVIFKCEAVERVIS